MCFSMISKGGGPLIESDLYWREHGKGPKIGVISYLYQRLQMSFSFLPITKVSNLSANFS